MRMSEKDLAELVRKNPNIRIRAGPVKVINKYRNIKLYEHEDGAILEYRDVAGHGRVTDVYDSKREYDRWRALQLLERAGEISGLRRQVTLRIQDGFTCKGEKIHPIGYKADFVYSSKDGKKVVEDVKAFDEKTGKYRCTTDFTLKWKLLKSKYPEYNFVLY